MARVYGLHRNSILNSSRFFHVTDGLPPDIMHDISEGSLQYEVKELLNYLIREEVLITLEMLNQKIEKFPYQQSDKANKPAVILSSTLTSTNHSVKQKGMCTHNYTCMYMCIM